MAQLFQIFLTISSGLTLLLGLVWVMIPRTMLAGWGTSSNPMLDYMSRRYGTLFFGYTILLFIAGRSPDLGMQRGISISTLVITILMSFLSLAGILRGTINRSGLIALIVETCLAVGFGYFLWVIR